MKTRHLPAAFLLVALGAIGAAAPTHAQEPVGRMALVRSDVRGTPPGGAAAAMAVADPVVLDHLIETGRASAARLTLDPEGVLSLGQETQLTIDRATINQATGRSESVLTLLLGKIELALGSLFRGEMTVETPSASLGVKGTVLRVLVDAGGRTLVAVLEGVVEVTSKATGETVTVRAGEYTIVEPGGSPQAPAPFDPSSGTLSPSAGGPDFAVPGEDLFDQTPLLPDEQRDLPREPPVRGQNEPPGVTGPDGP
jgi:ferric-dicitrate binding protein FerR (iron transport regulator)